MSARSPPAFVGLCSPAPWPQVHLTAESLICSATDSDVGVRVPQKREAAGDLLPGFIPLPLFCFVFFASPPRHNFSHMTWCWFCLQTRNFIWEALFEVGLCVNNYGANGQFRSPLSFVSPKDFQNAECSFLILSWWNLESSAWDPHGTPKFQDRAGQLEQCGLRKSIDDNLPRALSSWLPYCRPGSTQSPLSGLRAQKEGRRKSLCVPQ